MITIKVHKHRIIFFLSVFSLIKCGQRAKGHTVFHTVYYLYNWARWKVKMYPEEWLAWSS
jgi:hypothetical protein